MEGGRRGWSGSPPALFRVRRLLSLLHSGAAVSPLGSRAAVKVCSHVDGCFCCLF